jgi:aspartyl-tRNA(Asn)/glutamyl-tRNA(Gln) amidotransferase subunit A
MSLFLADSSVSEIAARIRRREVSALQVTEACLARIAAFNPSYQVYITILRDEALQAAREDDAQIQRGDDVGPLHGVPLSVKDVFIMRGTMTTVGSPLLRDFPPGEPEEATCVQRLRQAGAIILGKVNVGSGLELNASATLIGAPRNPWSFDCTPGGSSSGSAVAVALGMGYASVGTDLGGSIRTPAALTGVVGLKPTYGRVSTYGDVFCLSRALEHVGPITRTVRDAALLLRVLAGRDPRDPDCADAPVPDYPAEVEEGLRDGDLRIAAIKPQGPLQADPEVWAGFQAAIPLLARAGATIEEIPFPVFGEELWYQLGLLREWELVEAHAPWGIAYSGYLQTRLQWIQQKVLGHLAPVMEQIQETYRKLFARFDILLLPTTPITATPAHIRRVPWAGQEKDVLDLHISYTWVFNLTGHPAISLPCGFTPAGLPVGLQMVGRRFDEGLLLKVAGTFEKAFGQFRMPDLARLIKR